MTRLQHHLISKLAEQHVNDKDAARDLERHLTEKLQANCNDYVDLMRIGKVAELRFIYGTVVVQLLIGAISHAEVIDKELGGYTLSDLQLLVEMLWRKLAATKKR